jgi:hypothetical protein
MTTFASGQFSYSNYISYPYCNAACNRLKVKIMVLLSCFDQPNIPLRHTLVRRCLQIKWLRLLNPETNKRGIGTEYGFNPETEVVPVRWKM